MYSSMTKVIREIAASFIIFLALINSVSATVELTDFFSDFTTSEVTVNSDRDLQGKAVFELLYSGNLVESHEVSVNAKARESLKMARPSLSLLMISPCLQRPEGSYP